MHLRRLCGIRNIDEEAPTFAEKAPEQCIVAVVSNLAFGVPAFGIGQQRMAHLSDTPLLWLATVRFGVRRPNAAGHRGRAEQFQHRPSVCKRYYLTTSYLFAQLLLVVFGECVISFPVRYTGGSGAVAFGCTFRYERSNIAVKTME